MAKAFLAGFCLLAAGGVGEGARNVVLFVVDDQGLDAGCFGNPVIQTPNLDRLAAEGTIFRYAFCTTASCSASRSVILSGLQNHATGQYGHEHSYNNFHSFGSLRSLPVLLGELGYRTGRVGKYHVQPEEVYAFETVVAGRQGGSRNPVSMAEACQPFIRSDDQRPFFLYFCTSDPHRGGGRARDLEYQPDYFGNNRAYDGVREVAYNPEEVIVPPFLPDTPECRAELAQYYQSVSRIDQGLGRLVEILKEAGRYEDTLILYTSDNGIAFPGAKTTLYEPGMRLPLVVRHPAKEERGIISDAMISWVDFTPTILDWAGGEIENSDVWGSTLRGTESTRERPYRFHGRSFLGVIDQRKPPEWDTVFASHTFHEITMYYPMRVIRTPRYKLLMNLAHPLPFPFASDLYASPTWQGVLRRGADRYGQRKVEDYLKRPQYELYDLHEDPGEVMNLAGSPDHQEILEQLQNRLRVYREQTEDPWTVKYHYE